MNEVDGSLGSDRAEGRVAGTLPVLVVKTALVLGFFFFLILLFASQNYLFNPGVGYGRWILWNAARWLPWAAFIPLILRLCRRFPLVNPALVKAFAVHTAACLVFSAAAILATYGLNQLGFILFSYRAPLSLPVMAGELIHFSILTYWGILITGNVFEYRRKFREREVAASHLEAKLARANLAALKAQIQPHFLYNTLQAISSLVYRDPEAADRMIGRLSDLLRMTIDRSDRQEVPLREEVRLMGLYLEIMKIRFEPRLSIHSDFPEETLDVLVPGFLLQPIVENAVRYAVAPRREGGRIDVRALRSGEKLVLEIRDDGPGFREDTAALLGRGMGLANTAERLRRLHGRDQSFRLDNPAGGGARVTIEIPWRIAA